MAIAPQSKQVTEQLGDGDLLFGNEHAAVDHMWATCPIADDLSQTEDLIVRRSPTATITRQNEAPIRRQPKPPATIGHGYLSRKSPTWKPGDPFNAAAIRVPHEFDWLQMLRMAGLTVALGALVIWMM